MKFLKKKKILLLVKKPANSEFPQNYSMTLPTKILVLGGDGVGPEVTSEAVKVLQTLLKGKNVEFEHHLIGGAAIVN